MARLGDAGLEEEGADAGAARLGPDHHADDVADVAHLQARLALAADRAEQAPSAPRAEHELAAVAPLEAEPVQVVGRLLLRVALGVGGERLGMEREHVVAQPLVVDEVGRAERADRGRLPAHPPM